MKLFACAGILMLLGCTPADVGSAPEIPPGAPYVALGSSFAAGAGIGPAQPGTPERCGRTVNNYASLLAARLELALDDQSCSGAKTVHVLEPWNELPAQIEAVNSSTRLVTVTIGGNDLNYVGNLFMASCTPGETVEAGEYEYICVTPTPPEAGAYEKLEFGLEEIARQVKARAPQARLVFVQYVSLAPDEPCAAVKMSEADAQIIRDIGLRLAEITARVARSTGSLLLESERLSLDHTPCDQTPWANGRPEETDLSQGAPWHPNAVGHQALAEALAELL